MKQQFRFLSTTYIRLQLGLTQQQLADNLGISRSALAMAETGRRAFPAFALPILQKMVPIANKMPAPENNGNRKRTLVKDGNNRVNESSRLHSCCKKPFVTGQSSIAGSCSATARTKYTALATPVSFSTHLLQSHADCQNLVNRLFIKKDRLQGQLAYMQLEAATAVNRGKELAAELFVVNSIIPANLDIIAAFPLYPGKRKLEHRNAKLQCKKLQLEDRLAHFDAAAMVLREYTINVMIKQLEMLQQLIDAIQNRRKALEKNTMPLTMVRPGTTKITGELDRGVLQQRA